MVKNVLFYFLLLISAQVKAENVSVTLKQLSQALSSAHSGDTIFIDSGTYSNVTIKINKRKFDSNVLIRPVKYGEVIIQNKSLFLLTNCSHIKFEGFHFQNTAGSTFILNGSNHIEIYNNYFYECGAMPTNSVIRVVNGSAENLIESNTFDGLHSQGILIATYPNHPKDKDNTDNIISKNYFCNTPAVKRIYPNLPRNGMEAIMIGFGGDRTRSYNLRTIVSQNLFERIIGDGNEIISNKTSGNRINDNTFLDNKSGIVIRAGNNVKVKGNYFYNDLNAITLYGAGHEVSDNCIVNCNSGISMPSADFLDKQKHTYVGYSQAEGISILNNIIVNPKVAAFIMGSGKRALLPKGVVIGNNKIYSSKPNVLDKKISNGTTSLENNRLFFLHLPIEHGEIEGIKKSWTLDKDTGRADEAFLSNDSIVGCSWLRPTLQPWDSLKVN